MEEIFKDIPGYEGLYQVSNLGRVKSLSRKVCNYRGCYFSKERILKQFIRKTYKMVNIRSSNRMVHQLIAMAFLNHIPCGHKVVVDHINHDKLNNRLENLQLITNRENCSKDVKNKTSKYTGVSWSKSRNKWVSQIKINGKTVPLGRYKCELVAYIVYQKKLKEIQC